MKKSRIKPICIFLKKIWIVTALLAATHSGFSQEIKKIGIKELQSYIQESSHPLIVNFWATYCGPCIEEIPYFQKVVSRNQDKDIELLLVSLDLPGYFPDKIAAFAQSKEFKAPIIWLNETNADYFCPMVDKRWSGGIPASLFVNNKTHFRKFFERQLTEMQMEETIDQMLR